ncbi:phage structural protein [Rhodospirillum sp. A1_3_36]|uniref:phage structural protein n=1 Tax=Rhodospirillum sp. A1_3_36 TaxID=3391666 RepID=UPI0039A6B9C6
MPAYSFLDVHAAIDGPGGNIAIGGEESGTASEGISLDATGDKNAMTVGADGSVMHTLRADKSGTVTINLLKTSSMNAQLQNLLTYQEGSSARWGQNTITVRDTARGDTYTCTACAFAKDAPNGYAEQAGNVVWTFHAGRIDRQLGTGTPEKS